MGRSGDQTTPAAWSTETYAQLQTSVYNYTYGFMSALAADGIYPQYVQVGNEINSGMLWPIGSVGATTPTATTSPRSQASSTAAIAP